MKCDEFLATWESGGWLARRAARRHAARCAECARTVQALSALKQRLASAEHLSPAERQVWMKAAHSEPASVPFPRRGLAFAVAGGACAAAAVAIGWGWYGLRWRPGAEVASHQRPPIAVPDAAPLTIRTDPAAREGLVQLALQLDELARQAALLDERQQLRELMQQTP